MKFPEEQYIALLIKSKNVNEDFTKIETYIESDEEEAPTCEIVTKSTIFDNSKNRDLIALASFIVNYLDQRNLAKLDEEEAQDFAEKIIRAIKTQEKNIKALTKLAPQDRYRD